MLLLKAPEPQGQETGVVAITRVDRRGAAPAEAHGAWVAALGHFDIGRQFTAQQLKILSSNAGGELKGRAADRLTVCAVTDTHQRGINSRLPGDVSAQAGAVNLYDESVSVSEHLVGEELEHHRVLYAQQHAAHLAALAGLFPWAEPLDDALAGAN